MTLQNKQTTTKKPRLIIKRNITVSLLLLLRNILTYNFAVGLKNVLGSQISNLFGHFYIYIFIF